MNKKIFFFVVIIVVFLVSVPVFAGVSIDLGVSALGNAVWAATRPAGAITSLGVTLFDNKAIVQVTGGFFSPPLGESYDDPAGIISTGVLYSPMEYLYMGFRTGMLTPSDTEDWTSYGALVFRIQKPGKGLHYFAETEVSLLGNFNRFSTGVNLTL